MADEVKVILNKICAEDLETGTGQVQQNRQGQLKTLTQINASHIPVKTPLAYRSNINDLDTLVNELDKVTGNAIGVSTEQELRDAITNAGNNNLTIVIGKPIFLTADLTVPEKIDLVFQKGAYIDSDTSVGNFTLTINSSIHAGLYKIFGNNLTVNGNPKIEAVYPEWFGAVGDGVSDDTMALIKALSFYKNVILLNQYGITQTLTLGSNISIDGGGAIKQLQQDIFCLYGNNISNIRISNIKLNGLKTGNEVYGFDNPNQGIYLVNCSNVFIENCVVTNFANQGITIKSCKDIYILHCTVEDIGYRNSAVNTPYSALPSAGAWLSVNVDGSATTFSENIYIRNTIIKGSLNTLLSVRYSKYVFIENCEIFDTDSNCIQAGTLSTNIYVRMNRCYGMTGLFNPSTEGMGISFHSDGHDSIVEGNIVDGSIREGINLKDANNVILKGNLVMNTAINSGNSTAGILFWGNNVICTDNTILNGNSNGIHSSGINSTIKGNVASGNGGVGIVVNTTYNSATQNMLIANNLVKSNNSGGIIVSSPNTVIQDNIIDNNIADGINIFATSNIRILSNVVTGAHNNGIYVKFDCDEVEIEGNVVSGATTNYAIANSIKRYLLENEGRVISYGTSPPSAGTWQAGDIVLNINPSVDANSMIIYGWICTAGGSPGTWQPMYVSTVSPAV